MNMRGLALAGEGAEAWEIFVEEAAEMNLRGLALVGAGA